MKANELRIGNALNFSYGNGNGKKDVRLIDYIDIAQIDTYNPCLIYEPIPLTEEILVKLGFYLDELRGKYRMQISTEMELFFDDSFGVYLYEDFTCCEVFMKDFRYVHELQNLYFALTGEELNVSEILK